MVPSDFGVNSLIENIENKSLDAIMDAIYLGVQNAYESENMPFNEYAIEEVNEYNLGQLLQFLMLQTMCIAYLIGVNAFNQPHVELYKNETRYILKSS